MADRILRFTAAGASVRGECIELDDAWQDVAGRHALPAAVREHLGELTAAALLLAATIKHDGALILQIHGDGPLKLAVVECRSDGSFRATVKLDDTPIRDGAGLSELVNVGGAGRCVVTLDGAQRSGLRKRHTYQGIVPLDGGTVAEVVERYMSRSEQIPTRLWLAADGQRVRGLMLQRMPDEGGASAPADPDAWNRFVLLGETLGREEMLSLSAETLARRLFWQESMAGADMRSLRFACSCSREKVADMLRMLGPDEVWSVIEERGEVEVRCEFCNETRRFDRVDCAALFVDGVASAHETRQ